MKPTIKIVTTPELHKKLKDEAKAENVSLNTYVLYKLALAVGKVKRVKEDGFSELFDKAEMPSENVNALVV